MNTVATPAPGQPSASFHGNDRLLFGIIMGVVSFWLFAQTTGVGYGTMRSGLLP